MEYIIIKADKHLDLISSVTEYISKGWRPQGGVAVDGYTHFYQAMVKGQQHTFKTLPIPAPTIVSDVPYVILTG